MEHSFYISQLIQHYLHGEISAEELAELNAWVAADRANKEVFENLTNPKWIAAGLQQMSGYDELGILSRIKAEVHVPVVRIQMWKKIAAAAIIAGLLFGAYLMFTGDKTKKIEIAKQDNYKNDVAPGGYKAKLTLADGRIIVLDSAGLGELAKQGNTVIINKDGQLVYNGQTDEVMYNTLSTAKGEIYTTTLSDGSKVWLNSSSSIRYPVSFTGNERKVEITGEAYFEAAPSISPKGGGGKRKFIVTGNGVTVEVLGTHFNVNTYKDESAIKVTLLEGSVKVNQSTILKPGEQAQVAGSVKVVPDVDLEVVMAWKNGNFKFKGASIETIMRQVERWYDVSVEFEGNVSEKLVGEIPRNVPLSSLLKMLERTDVVRFRIDGKKVTVMPSHP